MCRHVLLLRRAAGLPAFSPACFDAKWLREQGEVSSESQSEENHNLQTDDELTLNPNMPEHGIERGNHGSLPG